MNYTTCDGCSSDGCSSDVDGETDHDDDGDACGEDDQRSPMVAPLLFL